jgi:hypothetical protein
MDEAERTVDGTYANCETAVARCRQIVDESLRASYRNGMTAADLFRHYRMFGDDPWIATPDACCTFSAWTYAVLRSHVIAGETA